MLVMEWLPLFSHFKSTHAEGETCVVNLPLLNSLLVLWLLAMF